MLGTDAQDILQIRKQGQQSSDDQQQNNAADNKKQTKKQQPGDIFKRPEGMHRELYNLLVHQGKESGADRVESMAFSNTKRGYSLAKPMLGLRKVRKWSWKPFSPRPNLELQHWEREDATTYPFAKFNKTMEAIVFTDAEYEYFLEDQKWAREETCHLLELCHRFDLRWPVVFDRFEHDPAKIKKSMEDMKERYYSIINILNASRKVQAPQLYYDAESERRRKEQLLKLWERTDDQVKEEEELRAEVKRIEARKKERERKAIEVQRLINSTEQIRLSQADSSYSSGPGSANRLRKALKNKGGHSHALQIISDAHIRWPAFSGQGPHLRSQEMRVPNTVNKLKCKNLETIVEQMKLDPYPNAFDDVIQIFNQFRSNVIVLQELKSALSNAETDIDQLALRLKEEKEITLNVDPRLRVSDAFYNRTGEQSAAEVAPETPPVEMGGGGGKGKGKGGGGKLKLSKAPVTSRRIAQMIDIHPIGAISTRKRRNPHSPDPSTSSTGSHEQSAAARISIISTQ